MKDIDEAIKHAEEKAKELYCKADEDFFFDGDWGKKLHCTECAKEHEQLAEWMRELRHWRELELLCGADGILVFRAKSKENELMSFKKKEETT